ncbi:MGH1-like glycoside hydrolase domain-containing protein [Psychromonas antarctica]|uniref:MGH1-like glycoside hydrolase domain-containing protein n=1 Tax=Psychromonas antarctica TaxID=67573 RepID=UPI001EE92D60|nr:esterase [Psychromonas antarctica]MCG6200156.1 esterase [Psychromonas antarctica]
MKNFKFTKKYLATAILLAVGTVLTGCANDENNTILTCDLPQILDETQTACIIPEPTAPYAVDLYLKGGFSGWGAEDTFKLIFKDDGYYLENVEFVAGIPEFKVADDAWAVDTSFTVDIENLTQVEPDTVYTLQTGDGASNMALLITNAGLYDFKLEVGDDLLHPTFSYAQDVAPLDYDLYIRGGFNGWSTDNQLKYLGDNIYQVIMKVAPGNHEFKLAADDWSSEWVLGEEAVTAELENDYTMIGGGANASFFVTETGYYKFTVDASDAAAPVLHIVATDGSEGVEVNPHAGRENIQKLTFTTYDDKEEAATFSADDVTAQYRSYAQSTTQDLRDPGDGYVIYQEKAGQPTIRSGNLAFDALFSLAVNETEQNSVSEIKDGGYNGGQAIDCNCFETGAKWHYVWTRDLSYAANLGLALLDPERVKTSLEFKLSGYRDGVSKPTQASGDDSGLQIVQDTGSGGSWPISTDRVTWAFGAEKALQNLSGETRDAFALKAYKALINTVENDRKAAYDNVDGLYNGEQSFLDWREQTYASWIVGDIASMGSAKALSTNAAHYQALTLIAKLATEQGAPTVATKYQGWADALKIAINKRFWLEDAGMYSSLTAGHQDLAPLHKFDWLGQSLTIITGIADTTRANKVLASYPHSAMGAPVIFPQQPDVAIYHNRAIWPFVTAYGLKAAAQTGNTAVANAAYQTLFRAAALNLSNMENLEWLSLKPNLLDFDNPSLSGPVINSQRQLWSVGAYIGMVIEDVFGVSTDDQGINLKPFITSNLRKEQFADSGNLKLQGLTLQGKVINLEIVLPEASEDTGYYAIQGVTVNGNAATQAIAWTDLTDTNNILITLGDLVAGSTDITKVTADPLSTNDAAVFAPKEPLIQRVFADDTHLAVEFSDTQTGNISYNLYRNGVLVKANVDKGIVADTITPANGEGSCYAVEAVYAETKNYSHHSAPVCFGTTQNISVSDVRVVSNLTVTPADGKIESTYLKNWGDLNDILTVSNITLATAGDYDIQLQYHNSFNAINLGITNGVKWLQVKNAAGDILAEGVIQMPHAAVKNAKKPLVYSTPLAANLAAGTYSLEVTDFYNMSYLSSNTSFIGSGGTEGAVNKFDIAAIRIQPVNSLVE